MYAVKKNQRYANSFLFYAYSDKIPLNLSQNKSYSNGPLVLADSNSISDGLLVHADKYMDY